MANNLFVAYDLHRPSQNYDALFLAIQSLGPWAKVQQSLWYVRSNSAASVVAAKLWQVMDANDSLIVIDTTNNTAAWYNLGDDVAKQISAQWHAFR